MNRYQLRERTPPAVYGAARRAANLIVPSRRRQAQQWARIADACQTNDFVVARGPFSGLRLKRVTTGSHAPKALGSYELELHEIIEQMIERGYDAILDVGAGEGYYAVGLVMRQPNAISLAFDTARSAQAAVAENAALNGVGDRVLAAGECSPTILSGIAERFDRPLIVIDCEGCEDELLQGPTEASRLSRASLIIETHEFARPGVTERLRLQFTHTHLVELVEATTRDVSAYPELKSLSSEDQRRALDESRPSDAKWLVLRPREPSR